MEQRTVFLLEDDPYLLSCLKTLFKDEGYAVTSAASISEAREKFLRNVPDLMILDLVLPDGFGLDFLREVRAQDHLPFPVLILTGAASPENFTESFLSEADHFIQKPVSIVSLLAMAERLLIQSYPERTAFSRERVTRLRPVSYLIRLLDCEESHPHRFLVTVDASEVLEQEDAMDEVEADALLKTLLYRFLFTLEKEVDPSGIETVVAETGSDMVISLLWEKSQEKRLNGVLERTAREVEQGLWRNPVPTLRPVNIKCVSFQPAATARPGRILYQALRKARTLQCIALSEMRMVTYVQRVVSAESGRTMGYEMLNRAERNLSTDYVYRCLERFHLLAGVERRNIRAAAELLLQIPPDEFLSINVSPESLLHDEFPRELFSELGSQAYRIFLEFTERSPILETTPVLEKIAILRKLGFGIALDDVGAGFNNLMSLVRVRPDMVKVDKSMIQGVARDPYRAEAVRSILQLARKMHAVVLAEGVENREDLEALLFMKVDLAQGYYFHVPDRAEVVFPRRKASVENSDGLRVSG